MTTDSAPDVMSGAELRVVTEYLGLHQRALAGLLHVTERTVARWIDGSSPVPDGIRLEVEALELQAADVVDTYVAALNDASDAIVTTVRRDKDMPSKWDHLPASWHRAVIARVIQDVPGVEVYYEGEVPES